MTPQVTAEQALAWRMNRHLLDPVGGQSVVDVVRRLCGVQAQVFSSAEMAIRVRRVASAPDEVSTALFEGALIKTWAMRGTLHLLAPEDAGAFLSLMASGRSWERPSWQRHFGVSPDQIETLRGVVREALGESSLIRDELVRAVTERSDLAHIGEALNSGWGTLLKPLAWQGDICHGPNQGNRATFMRPEIASARWAGIPDPAEAAPVAITSYLGAHGPAKDGAFSAWLSGGWFGKQQLRAWFEGLRDRIVEVGVDGEPARILAEHLDELMSTAPTEEVRLLPGFDQYVLGPGTKDGQVIPEGRRAMVSKQSGWIAPVVVAGGVVSGTWEMDDDLARVAWFTEAGKPPEAALAEQVARLSGILDRSLGLEVSVV